MRKSKTLDETQVLRIRGSGNPEKVVASGKFIRDLDHNTYGEFVEMFEKRNTEWYLDIADYLDKCDKPGANFTVTILCCILLDLLSQYVSGSPASSRKVFKGFFRGSFTELNHLVEPPIKSCYYKDGKWFEEVIKDVADGLYHCFRCGVLHSGRILEYGRINPRYPEDVVKVMPWNGGREINLNPSAFLEKLKKVFKDYVRKLKAEEPGLKVKFLEKIKWEYGIVIGG